MFREGRDVLSFKAIAALAGVLFAATLLFAGLLGLPDVGNVTGILFHVAMVVVVGTLPAPLWARGAGFGWLALDICCGAMMLYGVPFDIAWPVRLGGHILAGMWLLTVSGLCTDRVIRYIGFIPGLWLPLVTFFAQDNQTSKSLLGPPGVLVILWLLLVAAKFDPVRDRTPLPRLKPSARRNDAMPGITGP
jgi:hypothetical protein